MEEKFKTSVQILSFVFFLTLLLTGCILMGSPREKSRELLDKFTDKMVACYAKQDEAEIKECREEILPALYKEQEDANIPKEIFDKELVGWEVECKRIVEPRRYSVYVLNVKGIENPVKEKIVESLKQNDFSSGNLQADTIEDVANRFGVLREELGDEIVVMYPERAVIIAEKIREILKEIPEAPKIKTIVKGNEYPFSFGIFVPAA